MIDNGNVIPIFFSADDAYAPFLGVALKSAVANSSPERRYKAIVLHQNLSEDNICKLSAIATENFSIEFVAMEKGLGVITDKMSNRLRCDYFTLTIYFRLFIPEMFPQYDKGIYIDSDIVVAGDIADMYDIDIGHNYIGACSDRSISEVPELMYYVENAVGVKGNKYINSGVLLMNLKKLREIGLEKHFFDLLNTYQFDSIAPDQDYINAICAGNIYYMDESWDAMPNDAHQPLANPNLIHYNLFSKPWCYDGVQYEEYFWKYAEDSAFNTQIVQFKNSYSDEQRQSDKDCLNLLIKRGEEIPLQEVTFKKLHEKGVKIRL